MTALIFTAPLNANSIDIRNFSFVRMPDPCKRSLIAMATQGFFDNEMMCEQDKKVKTPFTFSRSLLEHAA